MMRIAAKLPAVQVVKFMNQLEPHIPWNEEFLRYRMNIYKETKHSLAPQAEKDLNYFLKNKTEGYTTISDDQ